MVHTANLSTDRISELLGQDSETLLNFSTPAISKDRLHTPSADFVDKIFANSNRNPQVLRSLGQLYGSGRLANTGYVSILPVDQGIEHTAGASFASNPDYFDPENIIKLAIEGGCNAVATTFGNLALMSRKYAMKSMLLDKHRVLFAN